MRLSVFLAFGFVAALASASAAQAQIMDKNLAQKMKEHLQDQRDTLKQLQAETSTGKVILVPTKDGVLPVSTADYRNIRESKILFGGGSDADQKAALAKLDQEVADLKARSNQFVNEMDKDLDRQIKSNNDIIKDLDNLNPDGTRKNTGDSVADDVLNADTKASPSLANPNSISSEELADSPPASDAGTRTLTVNNTPTAPPDGTPIIDASASPPPSPRSSAGSDSDDAFIQGIVGVAGQFAGQNGRGRGRHNGGGNGGGGSPQSQASPHPGGCN